MTEIATLAGGCFWCTEAIFKRLKGVVKVTPGFSGGTVENPSYDQVVTENTGHAEAIQIEFDPSQTTYQTLLDVFFASHDPTSINRQEYDIGTMYRSVIFYHSDSQKKTAEDTFKNLENSNKYQSKIVTQIEPFNSFYRADNYHLNYYDKNPDAPYCKIIIDPKIQKLLTQFPSQIKSDLA